MIQVEIGGHPFTHLAQDNCFLVWQFFHSFWVLNFWGRFEALNDVFWQCNSLGDSLRHELGRPECVLLS